MGLLIPFGVIYLMFLLDTKVRSTKELVKALKELPLLAEIPQFAKNKLLKTTIIGKSKLYQLNPKHVKELQKILGVGK